MVQAYGPAAAKKDLNGRIPLMLGIEVGMCEQSALKAIKLLESVTADYLGDETIEDVHDNLGKTVMHFISENTAVKVAEFLVDHYPDSLRVQDSNNYFPLLSLRRRLESNVHQRDSRYSRVRKIMSLLAEIFPTAQHAGDLWHACKGGAMGKNGKWPCFQRKLNLVIARR